MRTAPNGDMMEMQSCLGQTIGRFRWQEKGVISMAEKPTKKPTTGTSPQTPTTAKKPKREKGKKRTQR
jgi:hypothetical protein